MGKTVDDMQVGCLWQGDSILTVSLSGFINYLDLNNPSTPRKVLKVRILTDRWYDRHHHLSLLLPWPSLLRCPLHIFILPLWLLIIYDIHFSTITSCYILIQNSILQHISSQNFDCEIVKYFCEPSFDLPKHSISTATNGHTFFSITQGHNKPITAMALLEGTIYSAAGATDSHISILLCGFPTAY